MLNERHKKAPEPEKITEAFLIFLVARPGIEPGTQGFSIQKTTVFLMPYKQADLPFMALNTNTFQYLCLPL